MGFPSDSSSLADWVGASGQWAGALGAAAAVVVALRAGRVERARVRAEREDREAAQARLVLVSVEHRPGPDPATEWFGDEPDWGEITVVVYNYSSAPVLLPWVVNVVRVGRVGLSWFPAPGQPVRDPAIPAQGERHFHGLLGTENYEVRRVFESDSYSAEVGFTDAAGLVWRRTDQGLPVRHLDRSGRRPGFVRFLVDCWRPRSAGSAMARFWARWRRRPRSTSIAD